MTTTQIPTEEQVIEWISSLSNWGRWGDDDESGTLNLITDAKRAQAARLVQEGITVTCSRLIVPEIRRRRDYRYRPCITWYGPAIRRLR